MAKILIIDDEKSIRAALRDILEYEGYDTDEAKDGEEGIDMILKGNYDVALCGLMMPKAGGFDVLYEAYDAGLSTQIIIITSAGSTRNILEANRLGAFDFIVKPPDLNHLLETIQRAMAKRELVAEARPTRKKIYRVNEFVGKSPQIMKIKSCIREAAHTKENIHITGPSGVGKSLIARCIQMRTRKTRKSISTVNCATIPAELLDSELFGFEPGAFPGAGTRRIGKLEQNEGGALFLDNVECMNPAVQAKLMQAILDKSFTRIGGPKQLNLSVRFLSASRVDLRLAVADGQFRLDLYYHLTDTTIDVPALADRREDIPILIDKFLQDTFMAFCIRTKEIDPAALNYLRAYPWKENGRELRTVIERLVIMCDEAITLDEVKLYI